MRKKGKHRQRAGIMVSIYRKRAKRRTKMRAKRRRKERWRCLKGRGHGFSIHPGPGELAHQGHHHLEVRSLPEMQKKKILTVERHCGNTNAGTSEIHKYF